MSSADRHTRPLRPPPRASELPAQLLQAALALPLGGFATTFPEVGTLVDDSAPHPTARETMTTGCVTQAKASATAAKPPSTTKTSRRPGSQRRTCFIICRTQSTLVLCRRRLASLRASTTRSEAVAHTRGSRVLDQAHHGHPLQATALDDMLLQSAPHRDRTLWR